MNYLVTRRMGLQNRIPITNGMSNLLQIDLFQFGSIQIYLYRISNVEIICKPIPIV